VHRLDRPTSGALAFVLRKEDVPVVEGQFARGEVEKRYVALCRGHFPDQVHVDHPVPKTEDGERVAAVTDFERVATFERTSLVRARPRTGRFHQIRRHLKHLSHPIVGDVNYGKGPLNREFRARFGLHRLALHALMLELCHPATGERLRFVAPLPADLRGPFAAMGLPTDAAALVPA
jgi:tRNA pseudouridine65 synthase